MIFLINLLFGVPLFLVLGALWLVQAAILFVFGSLYSFLGYLAGAKLRPFKFHITTGFYQ